MAVYVDDMLLPAQVGRIKAKWSHLYADTERELHRFAKKLGMQRRWAQKSGTALAHYDLTESKRREAIRLGAVPVGYMSQAAMQHLRQQHVAIKIAQMLGDISQGTVDPERALHLGQRVVMLACDNREGK